MTTETQKLIQLRTPAFPTHDGERPQLHIVLVEPEIPQNTGSIARLSAGLDAWLHLVKPLGFKLEDRYLKRAGLDYWPKVKLSVHESLEELQKSLPWERTYLFSTRGSALHWEAAYTPGTVLVYGKESKGLPFDWVAANEESSVRIPTTGNVRSLNLANSVSISAYEVMRQWNFKGSQPMKDRNRGEI